MKGSQSTYLRSISLSGYNQSMSVPIWSPSRERVERSAAMRFIRRINERYYTNIDSQETLYRWSVEKPQAFWSEVWEFCGVRGERGGSLGDGAVLTDSADMSRARWFPEARLNYARNVLEADGDEIALVARCEDLPRREITRAELRSMSASFALTLRRLGVRSADRVAAFIPNIPEALTGLLGSAAIGAIWSSCSPDFGVEAVVDRFGQIEPRILLIAASYRFKGKDIDCLEKARLIADRVPSIEKVLVVPNGAVGLPALPPRFELLSPATADAPIKYESLPFSHPLYILYSSGTTGKPKCIVHTAGGALIEHLKEHQLHTDISAADTVFYQTTTGWMMWNWLVSALASGARIVLYDGHPLHENGEILFRMAAEEGVTVFGTNAKFLALIEKTGVRPSARFALQKIRTLLSTGSPLAPEGFEYVYQEIGKDLCLSSISGGTDIVGCFALGSPLLPVYRGELQTRSLGYRVEVWDDSGHPLVDQTGELVCTAPFPSMPAGFWNDPHSAKFRAAYFERFPGVWHHGDYVTLNQRGGMIFSGRSDSVLKPGGVRIGTAEIYRIVESLPPIEEAVAVGQEWERDTRIVLFVKLRSGSLDAELQELIRSELRVKGSPHHVPKMICAVADIPRTRNGKISESAVREVINGREPKNVESLANPESLGIFRDLRRRQLSSKAPE